MCTQQKGEKEKHIGESWQSAPCYFPKTLPKHFDVCFCTHSRAHTRTHTSYPPKRRSTQDSPELSSATENQVQDTGSARNREPGRPEQTMFPCPSALGPGQPQESTGRTHPRAQMSSLQPLIPTTSTQGLNQATQSGRNCFQIIPGGGGHCNDIGDPNFLRI